MIRSPLVPTVLVVSALVSCAGTEPGPEETAPAQHSAPSPMQADVTITGEPVAPSIASAANVQATFSYSGELTQGGFLRGTVPTGTASASLGEQVLDIAPDGSFFAAFDRDSADSLPLTATLESGRIISEEISVSPRKWQIQRVNVAKRPSGSSEAWWKRREPEWNAIQEARAKETGASGWTQDFIWPVKGRISGLFGRQRIYRGEPGSYHSGIDIAPGSGAPFVAPADGVVVLARTGFSLEGSLIIIDHGAGLNSAFLHASRIVVEEGQAVKQGDHIGNVGSTGRATGPHLHWGLKWNAARLDPLLFTGPMN